MNARAFVLLLALAAAACAAEGVQRSGTTRAAPRAQVTDEWKGLRWEERHDVMTFAVLPNMARLFQRFRGSPDADMTCATCHGADADSVAFAMPRGLPALDPEHMPDANDTDPKRARIAKLMIDEVTPQMAELLGVPLYDKATRSGFSCFGCHPAVRR